ncbi:nucleotide sugar dehydrogenase [Streptomyces lancefieldiae]|uniref:Nucleotide sugar dehydrogenase n=1 Tax=Streptomyces lancefieldiae TaxID=3075520 RepID=A0ABU3ASR8_9ACTN|nr:nucleotide sugar dehydrogenase [Streptomyces sp. DSM 40712]MDT0612900.1 nucleotide sugar dehydrogenase [Streptomyces sp. DSM 40712]
MSNGGVSDLTVAVVGLGYVGLPTALALTDAGAKVIGIDSSQDRLRAIARGAVDLLPVHHAQLACAVVGDGFRLTSDATAVTAADAVVVCVPTPVDARREPDLTALSAACASVVEHAVAGQLIVLTSTSYVGTTRDLLTEPLKARGFTVDEDVYVAFAPERIDPGNERHTPERTPRLVGGAGPNSARAAAALLAPTASEIRTVDTPETAEMAKLWENTYRAVNIALANELADACQALGLAPVPVIEAAATKPYGFMPFYPGPGVGGHCIPCDPHYLLWQLREVRQQAPLVAAALTANTDRPARMTERALELLSRAAVPADGARVLLIGVAYKEGVADVRESPALEMLARLEAAGADVSYADPLVPSVTVAGRVLHHVADPHTRPWDLVVLHTVHPVHDLSWLADAPRVLDTRQRGARVRAEVTA